jgi:tripartite-type tricarboxylate transporter receptor subunit TctC
MLHLKLRRLTQISIVFIFGAMMTTAWAQSDAQQSGNFPQRTIKIIVPFNAGGPADS